MPTFHIIKISELFLFLDQNVKLFFPEEQLSMKLYFLTKNFSFLILLGCCNWEISYFKQLRCISTKEVWQKRFPELFQKVSGKSEY